MKITQLIEALEDIREECGDLEMMITFSQYSGSTTDSVKSVGTNYGEHKEFCIIANG
jgi:hypothetical protein